MLDQLKSKKIEVSVSKGDIPAECVLKSIENLGGISKFVNEGDQVFIKFNLALPAGFPTNTNPNVLGAVISSCKKARAKKIFLGSFPSRRIPVKVIYNFLDMQKYFENLGAELVCLDNSDFFDRKTIRQEELKKIKDDTFSKIQINNKEFFVPKIILNSDKYIVVNQVNVNPLFKCNLSLINSYSIIPIINQEIKKTMQEGTDYVSLDIYKKDLISNILDVFTIKTPNLVINDMFYLLESAGPFIYKDSNLKKTGLIIAGDNMIAVDLITLKILNLEIESNELILEAKNKSINIPTFSRIKVRGENLEEINTNIEFCVSSLKDVNVRNIIIKLGKYCSGCFKEAYHLLNLMKTYMIKDLKYNPYNSFLIGENPMEPDILGNIVLFGDCAINSTKNRKFRKVIKETKKKIKNEAKKKFIKKKDGKKKTTIKEKPNKKILELPGCPPNVFDCIELIKKQYGKKNVPNLNLLSKFNKTWISGKINKKFKIWEAL
ncbi:hypothetical protein LCGC14_0857820 [marine sediment metagenome]|uniref:DUF362 domain-containing protein n=1 Tax=marine sediment metagenome TaxID=412755 RepID=A0A0F9PTK5_9ZZZZ